MVSENACFNTPFAQSNREPLCANIGVSLCLQKATG
nr:MAG TPA: hypothetical protein [Caudoviricetes sp.]